MKKKKKSSIEKAVIVEGFADKPDKAGEKQVDGRKKTQFKPGVSGNPKGKKPGTLSLTAMIKKKLIEMSPDGKRDALEMLAENIIQDALEHNNKMRQLIWNYMDGMPRQGLDIKHNLKSLLTKEQVDELLSRRTKKDNAGGKVQPD